MLIHADSHSAYGILLVISSRNLTSREITTNWLVKTTTEPDIKNWKSIVVVQYVGTRTTDCRDVISVQYIQFTWRSLIGASEMQ